MALTRTVLDALTRILGPDGVISSPEGHAESAIRPHATSTRHSSRGHRRQTYRTSIALRLVGEGNAPV